MPSLISDGEFAEIRDALRDVTDTFHQLEIIYRQYQGSIDRFQRDRNETAPVDIPVNTFLEYKGKPVVMDQLGTLDYEELNAAFNYDYLQGINLIDANGNPVMTPDKDYMIIRGITFRIIAVTTDGQLKDTPVLVNCTLRKVEKQA